MTIETLCRHKANPATCVWCAFLDAGGWVARARRVPKAHQLDGVRRLVTAAYGFALFDEMGVGKTKQVVDAIQILYHFGIIDTVVVVTPAQVRTVWADPDPDLGELVRDQWTDLESHTHEYHGKTSSIKWTQGLQWLVTNYEFIRRDDRLKPLVQALKGRRFVVVAEEGGAVKDARSKQSVACLMLRRLPNCHAGWLLNGTPVDNTPLDLYGQGVFMAGWPERIFNLHSFFHFRSRYALMGGWEGKQIIGYQSLDDLRRRLRPWVVRRLSKDVLDLKDPIDMAPIQVPLGPKAWRLYKAMRDEAVAWLGSGDARMSVAPSGAARVMRLSQITGGFLGGLELGPAPLPLGELEDDEELPTEPVTLEEVGTEKQDALLEWFARQSDNLKLVVWCKFRPEVFRLAAAFKAVCPETHMVVGAQPKDERRAALAAFAWSQKDAPGRRVLVGQEQAGGLGLSFVASHVSVYYSSGYSLRYRLQTRKRTDRPPQDQACVYQEFLATGPDGQKTIDFLVRKKLMNKEEIATWTADYWRTALIQEKEAAF